MLFEFQEWHEKKSKIYQKQQRAYFREREIWWCSVGLNIGDEQNGKGTDFLRPVLILKKFSNNVFWGVLLTSKLKFGRFYYQIHFSNGKKNTVILSQLKLLDAKRLLHKITRLDVDQYQGVICAVLDLF